MNGNCYSLAELLAVGSVKFDNNRETEIYSFETNQWRRLQQFPYVRDNVYGMTAVYLKGNFYTFGGYSGGRLSTIARLDPIQGTFSTEVLKIDVCKENGQILEICVVLVTSTIQFFLENKF